MLNTINKISLSGLFLIILNIQLLAGDFTISAGITNGPDIKGEYIEQYSDITKQNGYRAALKYVFDGGFSMGRETFQYIVSYRDDNNDKLFIRPTIQAYTIGWAIGEDFRTIFEVSIPEKASVAIRQKDESWHTKKIEASWYGATLDLSLSDDGWGVEYSIRNVTAKANNFDDSGKDIDISGLYYILSLRHRW